MQFWCWKAQKGTKNRDAYQLKLYQGFRSLESIVKTGLWHECIFNICCTWTGSSSSIGLKLSGHLGESCPNILVSWSLVKEAISKQFWQFHGKHGFFVNAPTQGDGTVSYLQGTFPIHNYIGFYRNPHLKTLSCTILKWDRAVLVTFGARWGFLLWGSNLQHRVA